MIPRRFETTSFDSYVPHTDSQQAALDAVLSWLKSLESGAMLALVGSQGTGKSHLLYSAARQLTGELSDMDPKLRMGRQYPFVAPWYSLADQLRYGESIDTEAGMRQLDPHQVRAKLWDRPVVMLDEVRRTSRTEFDDSELAKFACYAYDNCVAVLITTNVRPLDDVMGPAAASRFTQIEIDGPDGRTMARNGGGTS